MKVANEVINQWLTNASRTVLAARINHSDAYLTLPQARKLSFHLKTIDDNAPPLRIGILHSYTSDLLNPWLELEVRLQGLTPSLYHAPFGLNLQEATEGSGLAKHAADLTVLLLQDTDLHPAISEPISRLTVEMRRRVRKEAINGLLGILRLFRERVGGQLVLTVLPKLHAPGLGLFDLQSDRSESRWRDELKHGIAEAMRQSVPASIFLDLDQALADLGRNEFFDLRLWQSCLYPYTPRASREVARRIAALGAVIKHPKAKVIALDADNTLWGGVIGEDGMNGIALGPDYPGVAYMDFQRRLLDYQQRGFVLVLCSKNNPEDLDRVLREHPHQLLRPDHFSASRVNWNQKPQNLIEIADELNLGLDSFVFVDDSEHECALMNSQLPQVEVVKTPKRPIDIATCLDQVARLEILALSDEDRGKTQLYRQQRARRSLEYEIVGQGGSIDDYLQSLKMQMHINIDNAEEITRLSQLTQKTNQFNLTTRRYDPAQIQHFIQSPDWTAASFTLSDAFGHSGIVGLCLCKQTGIDSVEIDTFLMSCRVIGRMAESAFLEGLLRHLQAHGIRDLTSHYLPTEKNRIVASFLEDHDFIASGVDQWSRSLTRYPPKPEAAFPIKVVLRKVT